MRFIFKVATVFVCSIILIAFLAACGVRTENDDKANNGNLSSTSNTSKGEDGDTDAVISFGSVTGSGESSITNGSSSVNDNNSDVSSGNSSNTQSNSSSNGGTDNSNSDAGAGSSTESSKPGNGYEDPDIWTDPV